MVLLTLMVVNLTASIFLCDGLRPVGCSLVDPLPNFINCLLQFNPFRICKPNYLFANICNKPMQNRYFLHRLIKDIFNYILHIFVTCHKMFSSLFYTMCIEQKKTEMESNFRIIIIIRGIIQQFFC